MEIQYDKRYDTLTITFATAKQTVCFEDGADVLYRVDPRNDRILGVTILGFTYRSRDGTAFNLSKLAAKAPLQPNSKLKRKLRSFHLRAGMVFDKLPGLGQPLTR